MSGCKLTAAGTPIALRTTGQTEWRQAMFRFSIRDVLWLILVVALGVSWLGERSRGMKLLYRYDRLSANVKWCPPEIRIVFD